MQGLPSKRLTKFKSSNFDSPKRRISQQKTSNRKIVTDMKNAAVGQWRHSEVVHINCTQTTNKSLSRANVSETQTPDRNSMSARNSELMVMSAVKSYKPKDGEEKKSNRMALDLSMNDIDVED